jgi:hypothetical protein
VVAESGDQIGEDVLDPAEVAPLRAALRDSTGETRATILEALVRLPLSPSDAAGLGAPFVPAEHSLLRPPWAEGEPPGFSDSAEPDARLERLERPRWGFGWTNPSPLLGEDLAPGAVTRWFGWAVGEYPDIGLGNEIVGWVGAYDGTFRPDLEGLFAQYRRAALAECAAWEGDRRPGTWFLRDPDFESWRGFRVLCWQIGWTVSRGGLRGLVPGLARPLAAGNETDRAVAALLIADAADYVLQAEAPLFGGGLGPAPRLPADPAALPRLLREAARAGVVPVLATAVPPPAPPPGTRPAPDVVLPPAPPQTTQPSPRRRPRFGRGPGRGPGYGAGGGGGGCLLPLALLVAAYAIAKWLGWLALPADADAPELDDVQCTVFAPPAASPGSSILVQAFVHVPEQADDARAVASELDVDARRRAYRSLDARVPAGGRLDFELRLPGLEIDDPVASLTWQGRTEAVQFGVRVPPGATPGTVIGTLAVSLDSAPVGHVKFTLAVEASAAAPQAEPQGEEARRYALAFVSYASKDRDEVLRRVQLLPIVGIRYFVDVLSLDPGDRWAKRIELGIDECDLFLLFWSTDARDSEWVRREVEHALARKAGDDRSPPEIRPVILEGPPIVPPWDDLAHLHFNDRMLYFMSRPR